MRATPSLFRVLRVEPALGRAFTEAEGQIGNDQQIILSHGLWQRLSGGDPDIIGRDVRLGWTGRRYTVVGVMPRGFRFFEMGDDGHARVEGEQIAFWLPMTFTDEQRSVNARTRYGFYHIGRLRPGATIDQVRSQIDTLNAANAARFPQFRYNELNMYTAVTPLQDALTRKVRRILGALLVGRLLEGQVFGVTPSDPVILAAVALATGLIALLACVSPARRATQVDPIRVLNEPWWAELTRQADCRTPDRRRRSRLSTDKRQFLRRVESLPCICSVAPHFRFVAVARDLRPGVARDQYRQASVPRTDAR
jgi:hypothetical protein